MKNGSFKDIFKGSNSIIKLYHKPCIPSMACSIMGYHIHARHRTIEHKIHGILEIYMQSHLCHMMFILPSLYT